MRVFRTVRHIVLGALASACGALLVGVTDTARAESPPEGVVTATYETRAELVSQLREMVASENGRLGELQTKYKARHPKIVESQGRLNALKAEMSNAFESLQELASRMTAKEHQIVKERFRNQIKLTLSQKRAELAGMKTRYRSKHPAIIKATREVASLENSLDTFPLDLDKGTSPVLLHLERIRLQAAIDKAQVALAELKMRYRDKHPKVIEVKAALNQRKSILADIENKIRPREAANNTKSSEIELLREEIALVEDHLNLLQEQVNSGRKRPMELALERIELLKLLQHLAVRENRPEDQLQLLEQQKHLLKDLLKSADLQSSVILIQRQLIDVRRAILQLQQSNPQLE
ncbi:MAG: Chromosome partition protein Smc [Verrucomicrobia subdivision 3 bacterium]|nr:Chromosome partition protein Smc [Limisphaerales bacterium]MCS1416563.1 Chromosome partition protein Smc [Limisphaerales bacterium]